MPHNRSLKREHEEAFRSTVDQWRGYWLTLQCCGRSCPLRHRPMDKYAQEWGDLRLPVFLAKLRCEICRKPAFEATMRRPVTPRRIGPDDKLLPLPIDLGWAEF
jgi:hypothetical protein